MPGFKDKKFKTKGAKKGKDRRVAGYKEIEARNRGEDGFPKQPTEEEDEVSSEEEESSSEEEEQTGQELGEDGEPKMKANDPRLAGTYKKNKKTNVLAEMMMKTRLNDDEEEDIAPLGAGTAEQQLTRKEREEIEKERKRKHFEKLHKEGKTDQAKADMERLAKIRAEREEAKKKREEEEAAKKGAVTEKRDAAYMAALAAESGGNRMRGDKSKENKKKKKDDERLAESMAEKKALDKEMYGVFGTAPAEKKDPSTFQKGSIEACREEEDDFM